MKCNANSVVKCLILLLALPQSTVSAQVLTKQSKIESRRNPNRLTAAEAIDGRITLAISPDRTLAVVGENKETFRVIRLSDFTTVHELVGHGYSGLQSAAFSADNRYLYTIVWDGSLASTEQAIQESEQDIRNYFNSMRIPRPKVMEQSLRSVRQQQSITSQLHRWDLTTGELINKTNDGDRTIVAIAGSPDGSESGIVSVRHESLASVRCQFRELDCRSGKFSAQSPLSLPAIHRFADPVLGNHGLRYTPSGRSVLLASEGKLLLIDPEKNTIRWQKDIEKRVRSVSLRGNEVWWVSGYSTSNGPKLRFQGEDIASRRSLRTVETLLPPYSGWDVGLVVEPQTFLVLYRKTETADRSDSPRTVTRTLIIDRTTGNLRNSKANFRPDLALDNRHFLAGAAKVTHNGKLVNALKILHDGKLQSNTVVNKASKQFGRPIYITNDDHYTVYENATSFVVWNLMEGNQESVVDRPSSAIPYSTVADRSLTTESKVAYDATGKTFLLAVPMKIPRPAKELFTVLGNMPEVPSVQGPIKRPYSTSLLEASVSESVLALGHEFFCGHRWQFFTWSIEQPELSPLADPIDAAEIDVVRNMGDWIVASVAPNRNRLSIDRLTENGTQAIEDFASPRSDAIDARGFFVYLLESGKPSLFSFMKESKVIAICNNENRLSVLRVDPFVNADETIFQQQAKSNKFKPTRFNHLFAKTDISRHFQIHGAAIDRSTEQLATLSLDPVRGGEHSHGPGYQGREPESRYFVNLFDTGSGRAFGRIMLPETLISLKLEQSVIRGPKGKEKTDAFLASWPIQLQLSPRAKYCSIRVGGEILKQGIIDNETKEIVRTIQTDQVLRFLNDGKHVLIGGQVVELKAGGKTMPIADFRVGEENHE